MKKTFKDMTIVSLAMGVAMALAGCSTNCGVKPHHAHKHYSHNNYTQPVMVYEESETVVAEVVPDMNIMKANMYTRSSRGGTSEMGYIKFAETANGTKMMVDLIDLRPGKDYVVKIYPCGNCNDSSCCSSKSMNVRMPVIGITEQTRLTQTYHVRGLDCSELNNAKIVLTRDGGYKAAWGRIYPAN